MSRIEKWETDQFDLLLRHLDNLGLDPALLVRLRAALLFGAEAQLLLALGPRHLTNDRQDQGDKEAKSHR